MPKEENIYQQCPVPGYEEFTGALGGKLQG
jgi:hypothetical protein